SSTPLSAARPSNHSASLKTVRLNGPKPPPLPALAVHFVTLPSNPNLYSWSWPVVVLKPLNHNALLKTVKSCGNKSVPMAVHFVTLPSFPSLLQAVGGSFAAEPHCIVEKGGIIGS